MDTEEHKDVDNMRSTVSGSLRAALALCFIALLLSSFGALCLCLLPWRGVRVRLSGRVGRLMGRGVLSILGLEIVGEGLERRISPAVYVCNHTSHLDLFLTPWTAPHGTTFIARRGLLFFPFLGVFYLLCGHLLIPRGRAKAAVEALQKNADFVKREGLGLWILPEGTRSADGRLKPTFKKGFAHLAISTGLPVVPVLFIGAHRAWPKHRRLPRAGSTIRVEVLDAVSTESWRSESVETHCAQIQAIIRDALPPSQRPRSLPGATP